MVPVLHIAGVPSTVQQKTRPLLHHTLGDGRFFISLIQIPIHVLTKVFRFEAYGKAAALFTSSQVNILDKKDAASQIDQVITDCITQVRSLFLIMYLLSRISRLVPCIWLCLPTWCIRRSRPNVLKYRFLVFFFLTLPKQRTS